MKQTVYRALTDLVEIRGCDITVGDYAQTMTFCKKKRFGGCDICA